MGIALNSGRNQTERIRSKIREKNLGNTRKISDLFLTNTRLKLNREIEGTKVDHSLVFLTKLG